ncbi:hypothetical protein T492DRAFT_882847 [Pavlovales sp. CCMP2436]|nr:hypothetical protein T492DRAFT_882847 [Pavlovales sp. CCMP2436]
MTKIVTDIKVLAELVAHEASRRAPKSRMYWRINGTRQITGGKRVIQSDGNKLDEESDGKKLDEDDWPARATGSL